MPDLTAVAAMVAETIEREANVRALFGEPVAVGGHTVIPVASVFVATGAGGGAGNPDAEDGGVGAGGGLLVRATPVGFIHEQGGTLAFTPIDVAESGWLGDLVGSVGRIVWAALQLAGIVSSTVAAPRRPAAR
jgi:uncharacterized spore protein YtfJ